VHRDIVPRFPNAGFEEGQWYDARHWIWPWKQAYTEPFKEIRPPVLYTAWWIEGQFCDDIPWWAKSEWEGPDEITDGYVTKRPEVTLAFPLPDPERISDGSQALKWFTFWRCHRGGLLIHMYLPAGQWQFSVMAHSWFTNCSKRPHDPPLGYDCQMPIDWANAYIRLGIDSDGGLYYNAPSVRWGASYEIYGRYGPRLYSPVVSTYKVGWVTFWLESRTTSTLKHNDFYVDDLWLTRR
jgi:hypothetical protein